MTNSWFAIASQRALQASAAIALLRRANACGVDIIGLLPESVMEEKELIATLEERRLALPEESPERGQIAGQILRLLIVAGDDLPYELMQEFTKSKARG